MRSRARWRNTLLAMLALGIAAKASAQAPVLALEAPESCPTQSVLEEEIASLVGRPFAEIVLPDALDGHIAITQEESRFVLAVHSTEGTRTLRDASCGALVRAAALIIALRIDADAATLAAATAADAPPPEPEPTPAPEPPAPARRRRHFVFEWAERLPQPRRPPELPGVAIGAGVIIDAGVVPVISATLAADIVLRADRFEARVRVAYVLEQGQPTHAGVSASAALGTLLGCGRPFDTSFPLAFCGGLEGGPLIARSYGVTSTDRQQPWTLAAVLGVWLPLIPWPGLDISLGIEAWARLLRPQFEIVGLGQVWDTDLFGGRFALLFHVSP